MNNLEGFSGDEYLRIYDPEHWDRINREYQSDRFIPGYQIIGSIESEAVCLGPDSVVYLIPFIPMSVEFKEVYRNSLEELKGIMEKELKPASSAYENYGLEVHFVKPIAFGGDPDDKSNVKFIPQPEHARICSFWNQVYFRIENKGI